MLIAGGRGERDRKLTVLNAARFAIVGQSAQLRLRVDDLGGGGETSADAHIRRSTASRSARAWCRSARTPTSRVPVTHEGENLVELSAAPGPAELTLQNNRAVVTVSGVRDRLRVLLVSGEPHAGERVWRNLLKADPSVDLVHFTILRPPDKQDATPINELSLIAFPTRELFLEKLDSFDLVMFDRYREARHPAAGLFREHRQLCRRMAARCWCRRARNSPGPESLYRTPLASVLPAQPTGEIVTQPFKPRGDRRSGLAHPVTRDLPGSNNEDRRAPTWGRWFRMIGANKIARPDRDERPGRPAAAGAGPGRAKAASPN